MNVTPLRSVSDGDGYDDDEQSSADELAFETRAKQAALDKMINRRADQIVAALSAPPLAWLDAEQFATQPRPEYLIPGLLHVDSRAVMFGPSRAGKSFVAMDAALCVATGTDWRGQKVKRAAVVYLMAEGQRVNVPRVEAWLNHHGRRWADLQGYFFAVTERVPMVKEATDGLAAKVREVGAKLIVLDTKNLLMVGEENSPSDNAALGEAMDVLRDAGDDACVLLIDHVGLADGTRPRGSTALLAGMDDAVVCHRPRRNGPIVAEIAKDKANAEDGRRWSWDLIPVAPNAVVVPAEVPPEAMRDDEDDALGPIWRRALRTLPEQVERLAEAGDGKTSVRDLALLMSYAASPTQADPGWVGLTLAEAIAALAPENAGKHHKSSVRRAWSRLISEKLIDVAPDTGSATARHVWTGPDVPVTRTLGALAE
ncbi:hypothetical protein Acsp06_41570 [Actinomycetospora sp. NBRC 106375]|uniref:AAA family ATPase n=1 Tax=Actinomycetospora sp. NBRC 106375 TaxID=3032207 RepID=UPI0024A36419|nr:AAA family ATPase [Actinomycetospora sp. NBRC 106375]GLZ47972.1 hypothetical protein Acsp06_41570 [Actinomycetospora sp. NBRC 106375]